MSGIPPKGVSTGHRPLENKTEEQIPLLPSVPRSDRTTPGPLLGRFQSPDGTRWDLE